MRRLVEAMHDPQAEVRPAASGLDRLGQPWQRFSVTRLRHGSHVPNSFRDVEDVEEVERLREVERRIAAATGWNSSTMVIGRVLERLRSGDHGR
jgi:hypothetical protein